MRIERGPHDLIRTDLYHNSTCWGTQKNRAKARLGKAFFVKSAALRDAPRDAVFPGAGRVPRPGRLVFGVRPDASRSQTQCQAREENREEGEDGSGK